MSSGRLMTMRCRAMPASTSSSFSFSASLGRSKMPMTFRLRIVPMGSYKRGSRKRAAVAFLHFRGLVVGADAQALLVFLLPLGLAPGIGAAAHTARSLARPALVVWHVGLRVQNSERSKGRAEEVFTALLASGLSSLP